MVIVLAFIYFFLVGLISVNVTQAFDVSFVYSVSALILALAIFGGVYLWRNTRAVALRTLNFIGVLALVATAATFAFPAFEIVLTGSSGPWTAKLTPMFLAALALYGTNIWTDAASASGEDALDWLARFLAGPNLLVSLTTALILCSGTLIALEWLGSTVTASSTVTNRFLDRGIIPPATVLLFYWGILLLFSKWCNSLFLKWTMRDWNSGRAEARSHVDRVRSLSQNPESLEDRLQFIWRRHEESFLVPRYIGWVVPVLGFIGTVLGMSLAADGIRKLFASESGMLGLSSELGNAIAPLGIAFDTTLIALSLSVFLTLFLSLVQRSEERILTTMERQLRDDVHAYGF